MAEEVKDQLEIKFRLSDASVIGPKSFPDATTVATLKETVVAQWPRGQCVCFYLCFTFIEIHLM